MTSAPAERLANEAASKGSSEVIVQKEVKQTWVSYLWDTFDKSPEERRLLFKLDTAILTFASLGMALSLSFISYLFSIAVLRVLISDCIFMCLQDIS